MHQFIREFLKTALVSGVFMLGTHSNIGPDRKLIVQAMDGQASDAEQKDLVSSFFGRYNNDLHQSTVDNFMSVAHAYGFSSDEDLFLDCIHQICLESQAKQSSRSGSGAMGIAQVTPTTAFDFIHKCGDKVRHKMDSLGASSMTWAIKGEYSYTNDSLHRPYLGRQLRKKAVDWLSDERNNLIVWGAMMDRNLSKLDKERAFLCFHLGARGLEKYKGSPHKHEYIRLMSRVTPRKKEGGS